MARSPHPTAPTCRPGRPEVASTEPHASVPGATEAGKPPGRKRGRPGRPKTRRQAHGSAWHWKQTDGWYYTLPGTKRRVPLFDEQGNRIRGKENRDQARLALARVRLAERGEATASPTESRDWVVARVCSEYIQYCDRGVAAGTISKEHRLTVVTLLNDLCKYCGALRVAEVKKTHIRTWVDQHPNWRSPATERSALAVVIAAFNYSQANHDVPSPLKGLKKPTARPRLHSLTAADEAALLGAVNPAFRDFLFAALMTGLRPFSELARLTAEDVEEGPRGMMWRVYASKTKKTRKIPVRPEVAALTRRLLETAPGGSGDLPRVRAPEPVVRLFLLPAVADRLAEDAVLVAQPVPHGRQL